MGDALIDNVISKYCISDYIIMDQDIAFMPSLINYSLQFDMKIEIILPYNHQSLQAEHNIKFLPAVLTKHLTGLGQMWSK